MFTNCNSVSDRKKIKRKCRFHDKGICRRKERCLFLHPTEICKSDKSHESDSCPKRHPNLCFFFSQFNKCKFNDSCSFKHVNNNQIEEINTLKEELKVVKDEVESLKNQLKGKDTLLKEEIDRVKKLKSENSTLNVTLVECESKISKMKDLHKAGIKALEKEKESLTEQVKSQQKLEGKKSLQIEYKNKIEVIKNQAIEEMKEQKN